jgi:hypothetical protein
MHLNLAYFVILLHEDEYAKTSYLNRLTYFFDKLDYYVSDKVVGLLTINW